MVKRNIVFATRFKRDYKRMKKRGVDLKKLLALIARLETNTLVSSDQDHPLKGEYVDCRECHISGDWIVVYQQVGNDIILRRMGTHQDIFKKRY